MRRKTEQSGITLIELVVALAVLAIMVGIAAPNLSQFIRSNRVTGQTNELLAALTYTRSEAVRQGVRTTLCASDNQSSCNGGNWAQGWIVWADSDRDDAFDANEVVRVHGALSGEPTLTLSDSDGNAASSLAYLPSGLTNATKSMTFELRSKSCSNGLGRNVNINITGRASVDPAGTCS